ncbi:MULTISPECIES: hypothetical protein [unclassified Sulfuricurvum]|uniref:hypothetical protein n=1 Tax=unclassified Sulfuricurvum TaxID=2632390 RepID=UPI00029993D0|nr:MULTISPECIES: hypothetical protein [unclassified Sulfuricurvum]AFV96912.1 hypothetical protein B649_02990 [Candidatus Sulfuricurvum sp. RIFRC-1]HBM35102.1 hypothetical protein [Sulfuricurvum sp.]
MKTTTQSLSKKQITLGMNTIEASLAGGAYFYRVIADEEVWDKDTDPNIIIKTQATQPDNSQIWMTFQNATQYPEKGVQTFQVEFQHGKVISINNISEESPC